jgi:CubicO group peptidase (beta-lactamase class C family)/DNA-binding CsgD family transcriptional regulator
VRAQKLRGSLLREATKRQREALAAFVEGGGSISRAAASLGIRPSTVKRHLADLRAKFGLTTVELIYSGRATGWLVVPSLEAVYEDLDDLRYALPELMRRLAAHPLFHQPGEGWRYGLSHIVLGRVIEVAAGQPLDEYFESSIFAPLGMVDSGFIVPPDKVARLAALYESGEGVLRRVDDASIGDAPARNEVIEGTPMRSGGGGCASTALDYLRFTRMLLRRGELDGVRLLKPKTVALMTRNHLAPPAARLAEGEGYGLGVGVSLQPSAPGLPGSAGTYGWGGAWRTQFWVDPVTETLGIFMVQDASAFVGMADEFWSLVCQALTD